jgi:serine/threonine-protein kinase
MGKVRIGDTIAGMYRVERVLGYGGMGIVVAARHLELGWVRAIKVMHPDPTGRQGWTHRFRREAQVGGRLTSEHAARVFDVGGFDEGRPYLVMEHLEGVDLGKFLRTRGPRPMDEAALFVSQACDALAEAHEMGVVHRDLKPGNLFVTTAPDGAPCIKVLDFGISKAGPLAEKDALELTQTGEVFGSPAYMAPEQIRKFAAAGPRSDVWSLGVILYELVTGRWPFPGKASVEMIAMVLEQQPDPPSRHRPGLPAAFERIVLQCLEKDPERRMPSALALRDALQPFLPAPHLMRSISDDVTKVAPPKRRPEPAPPPEPESVDVETIDVVTLTEAIEPGVQTTAQPLVGAQHPEPPRAGEGPSTRVVALVAASSLFIVAVTFAALIRRATPSAPASTATPESSAAPAAASVVASVTPVPAEASASILETPANPLETPAPVSEPITVASRGGGVSFEPVVRVPVKAAASVPVRSEGGGRQIDQVAALNALAGAAGAARRCRKPGGPTGAARVEVTFGPSGAVTSVRVGGPFDGTPVGKCIATVFRGASVPPFVGSSFSASKTVSIK